MTRPLVFVALANGTLIMFQRTMGVPHESPTEEPVWDLTKYHLIRLCPQDNQISDLISLDRYIWAGIANQIFVIDTLMHGDDQLGYAKSVADQVPPRVVACFEAHPRQESRIKTFSEDTLTNGQNVWVSVRLDSVVRLFSAKAPEFQHLMDVDIEPFVSSMIGTERLGFSFVRVTAVLATSKRLWLGAGNGIVISMPIVEVMDDVYKPEISHAQLALHGFRDAVRFLTKTKTMVIAGGMGSVDFRSEGSISELSEKAHLLAWQDS